MKKTTSTQPDYMIQGSSEPLRYPSYAEEQLEHAISRANDLGQKNHRGRGMSEDKTLKEIALELLEKYRLSETGMIWEMSGSISEDTTKLEYECNYIRKQIERMAEPKKGKWKRLVLGTKEYGTTVMHECSECKETTVSEYPFCPWCGAEMGVTE